jgi:ATP-dependent DNA helicase RecQ
MGIDRPDIDAVIHTEIPGSVEAYYQEIGRAGRDGRPAVATLFWHPPDVDTREYLIDKAQENAATRGPRHADPVEIRRRRELDHVKLRRMVAYAQTRDCLRATILRYFGDPAAREPCAACGNCLRGAPMDDQQLHIVRQILEGIVQAGERYGRRRIRAMLRGELEDLPDPLAKLPAAGTLSDLYATELDEWIGASISAGLIVTTADHYRTLSVTPSGREVLEGRVTDLVVRAPRRPRLVRNWDAELESARNRGRKWRRRY